MSINSEVITQDEVPVGVKMATSMIPWPHDDERTRYFGYIVNGLSVREALQMVDRGKSWLSTQRLDEKFRDIEAKLPELRKEFGKEFVELEFFRNFLLIMEKDKRVILESMKPDVVLSRQDHDYLLKLRSNYTPQQLQILAAFARSGDGGAVDFTKWVLEHPDTVQMSRTDTVTMTRGNKQADKLAEGLYNGS